jgi:signal transduction histidine kinase
VQACTTPTFDGDEVVCHVGTIDDVTARREVEQETRQAQKLEAVGQLAAGIAHEINTPIQFVGDNTRFLQDAFGDLRTAIGKCEAVVAAAEAGPVDPALLREVRQTLETADVAYLEEEVPKALAQTLEGVKRVATIVRAMKDFAHADTGEKLPADLNAALDSTITVARNELKYVADVETDFATLPPVECQLGELNQVFLNLLINAAHAIGDVVKGTTARGTIRVRTRQEGDTVLIAIGDTGAGIPEEIRAKVFDPFFTTKEVGRGTGQGLAIARSIVIDKHGGALSFESEVGRGTTFFIRLPVAAPAALKPEPHPPESAHAVG